MSRKSSIIWDYFSLVENDKTQCSFCKVILKVNQSSTTNLIRNVKFKHPLVDLSKRPSFNDLDLDPDDPNVVTQHDIPSTSPSPQSHPAPVVQLSGTKQQQISNYLPKPVNASKRNIIDQQVIKMIAKEYYPFGTVEDVEFKKLIHMLNPNYSLPSRKTISTSLLPILHDKIYNKVKLDIATNAQYISVTKDEWTSIKNESYTAVTIHFINQSCELKSYLLSCTKFSTRHTSENIKTYLLDTMNKWGLQNYVAACTSDNASNIDCSKPKRRKRQLYNFSGTQY